MKKIYILLGIFAVFVVFSISQSQDFVPGEIMVDFKHEYLPITPTPNVQGIIEIGLASIDSLNVLYRVYNFIAPVNRSSEISKGFYLLRFPDSLDIDQVLSSFLEDVHINMASLNNIPKPDVTPSDYYFSEQWGLSKMKCTDAWRYTNGSPGIIIQIIDGGTDYGHPDLVKNIWQNLGEDADGDGCTIEWDANQNRWVLDPADLSDGSDGDNNGYRNDLVGWDFWNAGDPDPQPSNEFWNDWLDHGDKTAGTAAAVTNNRITAYEASWIAYLDTNSVAGTSWFSRIMIGRIYDNWDAIDAIDYAIDNEARIISMSWSDTTDNALLHAKLDEAWEVGLLMIASAGNDSGEVMKYPAAYSNVIAVAGTDSNDVKAAHSNWGTWVDICAPWFNVVPSRASHWSYYWYDFDFKGTSASAPFVAGVAALVWSCNRGATNAEVRDALLNTADDICSIPGNFDYCSPFNKLGAGRVNALEAVKVFRPVPPAPGDCNADESVDVGDITLIINYLFKKIPNAYPPDPMCVGDVNDNGEVEVGDITYLINYLFRYGPPPLDGCD